MTKKEYCKKNKPIAYYYDGLNSLEIHGIKYDIDNYIYCTSGGALGGKKSYHKLKINYNLNGGAYFVLYGHRVPLSECIRVGA